MLTEKKKVQDQNIQIVPWLTNFEIATQKPNYISNRDVQILLLKFVCISDFDFISLWIFKF